MNNMIKAKDRKDGFWKKTLMLGVPIALQNMLTSSFTMVDTLMVGQLGDVALSSVGMAGQWSWLLNIVTFGVCSGASLFIAQFWGAKDVKNIHKISGLAITVGMMVALFFFLMGFICPQTVVGMFNSNPDVIRHGSMYLKIACFSYPGVMLGIVLGAILRSTEDVRIPVYSALFTTVVNAFLDYSMIFGKFGFPRMGIEGAALATCISAWLGPVIIILISVFKKNILYVPLKEMFVFEKKLTKSFFIKATPVVANEMLWGAGTFLYNVIFANLGYENYAAVTILKTIDNISFVFFIGLCNACCVMIGKNIGAGNIERAVKDSKKFVLLVPAMSIVLGTIIIFSRENIIGLFNLTGELNNTTIEVAKIITLIHALEMPVRNLPYIFVVGIFRSGGDTINGAKFDLLSLWLIALPLTFIFAFIIKAPFPVVYAAMYAGEDYVKTILCFRHYRTLKWIRPVTKAGKDNLNLFIDERNKKRHLIQN